MLAPFSVILSLLFLIVMKHLLHLLINLQPQEYKLLEVLMENSNEVITRTMLLEKVWDLHFDPQTNIIDVHISRLRKNVNTRVLMGWIPRTRNQEECFSQFKQIIFRYINANDSCKALRIE